MNRAAVIGAGTMGNGIAHVLAQHEWDVALIDSVPAALEKATATIRTNLDRQVKKGTLPAEAPGAVLGRIHPGTALEGVKGASLVVEAASENPAVKFPLFEQLDRLAPPGAILASNTSSIPITRLAASTSRPQRVVGMHFFNPVPLMQLVEVIRGLETSDETAAVVRAAAERMGKTVAEAHDYPGFISNRILVPMINEAVYALMEGVGDRDSIDTVMKLGMNHPMGPLELADLIGLDTCLAIMEVLHDGLGDSKYRPCPLLRSYVEAGRLGRKTRRGFYDY